MSLEQAILHGREHRKKHYGSKDFDWSCRNHGSCGWCEDNRKFSNRKRRRIADEKVREFGERNE